MRLCYVNITCWIGAIRAKVHNQINGAKIIEILQVNGRTNFILSTSNKLIILLPTGSYCC